MNTTVKTFAKPKCYLCGSEGQEVYHSLKDQISTAPGAWNLKMCTNPDCGLYWLDPMPFPEEIVKLYPTYYTHKIDSLPKTSFWEKPKYLSKSFLCSIPGVDRQRMMSDYRYLEDVKPGKLLDVGCGNGSFLKQMQARGWQVVGTDYDQKAIEAVKKQGLEAYAGDLSSIQLEPNSFDAITLNHVIEHLYDPLETLRECHKLLTEKGQITIATPNMKSLGHQYFKEHWRGLEIPRHLFLFSPQNLKDIAQKAGFKDEKSFGVFSFKQIIKPGGLMTSLKIAQKSEKSVGNLTPMSKYQPHWLALQQFLLRLVDENWGETAILLAKK